MKRRLLMFVITIGLPATIIAQDQLDINTTDPFVIEQVNYTLLRPKKNDPERPGRTKESTLRKAYGDLEQKGFATQDALDDFLQKYQQKLIDSRYFVKVEVLTTTTRVVAGQTLVSVEVAINDGAPFFPIPYGAFSSSEGLKFVLGAYLGNTGGQLFDTKIESQLLFPVRDGRLSWSDPNWVLQFSFTDIKAGPTTITFKNLFFDNRIYIADRGEEVYGYRSLEFKSEVIVGWPFTDEWRLEGSVAASGTARNTTLLIKPSWEDYEFGLPAQFSFTPAVALIYDNAPWIDAAKQGDMARIRISYILSSPVNNFKLHNDVKTELKYGYFWRPTDYFFPSLIAEFYWKTGAPEFDMGRFTYGITDNQWRGNGGLFVNSSFMFRIFDWKKVAQFQLGPVIGYGIVFEPGRDFDVADQGFTFGLTGGAFFDQLPSVPFYLTLAVDARKRHDNPRFSKRLEFDMRASVDF